jgi:hypothetical protein
MKSAILFLTDVFFWHRILPMRPCVSLTMSCCCHAHIEENDRDSDDADDDIAESAGRVTNELVNTYARNNPAAPEINLDDCTSLTDKALWAISSSRAEDCCIEKLSIRNCRAITDNGLLVLADSKVRIGEIDTRGVEQLTLGTVMRLIFECGAKMLDNLPTQLEHKIKEILSDKDPQSAVGKACLFLAFQPTVSTFTVPYTEETTSQEASMMLLSALKDLANLTIGGLELDWSYSSVSIDLALPAVVDAVGHVRDWPITENHFRILFSVPTFSEHPLGGSVLTTLSLSNSNLKAGVGPFAKALPGFLALKELDISNNKLGAKEAKPIGEALNALKVWPSLLFCVCVPTHHIPAYLSCNYRTKGQCRSSRSAAMDMVTRPLPWRSP